jgi:hypothetical protein
VRQCFALPLLFFGFRLLGKKKQQKPKRQSKALPQSRVETAQIKMAKFRFSPLPPAESLLQLTSPASVQSFR